MINAIELGNFKSIEKMKIGLAPLTILVGPNGSGKTSILESIALIAQIVRGNGVVRQSLSGDLVNFEDETTILFRGRRDLTLKLGFSMNVPILPLIEDLEIDLANRREVLMRNGLKSPAPMYDWFEDLKKVLENQMQRYDFDHSAKNNLQDKSDHRSLAETQVEYRFAENPQTRYQFHQYCIAGMFAKYERTKSSLTTSLGVLRHGGSFVEGKSYSLPLKEGKLQAFHIGSMGGEVLMPAFGDWRIFSMLREELVKKLKNVYYLSSHRGHIPWSIDTTSSSGVTWVGSKGEHTLEVLSHLMKPENREKWLPYAIILEKFGAKSVWSGWKGQSVLYSDYVDPLLGSSHKIPSLGFGSKQLIPVAVQLAYSDPGSVILVEEPETSLHPAFQTLLPVLFARAILEGKQVIVTTHSSYFPLSLYQIFEGVKLRRQTEEGKRVFDVRLKIEDVAVYHVDRDRNGLTKIRKLELDKEGLKHGIPSFIEVERKILGRYLGRE